MPTPRYFVRVIYLIAFLMAVLPSQAQERLSNGYTQSESAFFRAGFWWNSQTPGWGVDFHMANGRLVAGLATYDQQGNSTWFLGVGDQLADGRWEIPILRYRWANDEATGTAAGKLLVRFDDGHSGQLDWQIDGRSGSTPIEAFVPNNQPTAEDLTGFWYRTDTSGYGLSLVTQGEVMFGVAYLYDSLGNPSWVWVDNIDSGAPRNLNALRFTGPCLDCEPTATESRYAGTARLGFLSENEGVWSIDVQAGGENTLTDWRVDRALVQQLTDRASGRSERYRLQPITNADLVHDYLIDGLIGGTNYPDVLDGENNFSPAAPSTPTTSQTNLQERGVDETDLIKSDGQYIYSVTKNYHQSNQARLRVMRMADAGPELTELAQVQIGDSSAQIEGLYLVNDRADGEPDLLVAVVGDIPYYIFDIWFTPSHWYSQNTRLVVVDISDPANPVKTAEIELDGGNLATRRIDDQLYLVTRSAVEYQGEYSAFTRDQLKARLSLQEMLPRWRRNGVDQGALVNTEKTLLPPQPPYQRFPDMITISAFDLGNLAAAPKTQSYIGLAETVYVSPDNLYISSSRYGYGFDPSRSDSISTLPYNTETDVHQFELGDEGPDYRGSGAVAGYLPWSTATPAFVFSEHQGNLRVVSSMPDWISDSQQLSVLKLADDQTENLRLRSFIPNSARPEPIGKPGEQLYGVRYFGDRLYAVTFERIDPFYVIDISNPDDPYVAGELELPGFSDYLHPLSEDLVLGFGQNAVADNGFSWIQGLQLSLFDVSNPSRPALLQRLDIGRRGSHSPLLDDYHAFAMLPDDPNANRLLRFTIPLQVSDAKDAADISSDPSHVYDWLYSGLGMFEIDPNAATPELVWRDTLVSHSADGVTERPSLYDSRGLISKENAYLYVNGDFYAGPWGSGETAVGPF